MEVYSTSRKATVSQRGGIFSWLTISNGIFRYYAYSLYNIMSLSKRPSRDVLLINSWNYSINR